MRAVGTKNTGPELAVRRIIWRAGYRYRLHAPELPGRPDIVLRQQRKAIFVHGCFWHGHVRCAKARLPKTRVHYWQEKVGTNTRRDRARIRALRSRGWRVLVVWQCQLKKPEQLERQILKFLER